jgi:hypothetical protein
MNGTQTDEEEILSPHFTRAQLACPCCGECDLDRRLLPALEELRRKAGARPLIVLAACRCEKQNGTAKGVSKAAHLQGRAVDLRIEGLPLAEMYRLAQDVAEFFGGGIGLHDDGSIHVDVRALPARWARVGGLYVGIKNSGLLSGAKAGEVHGK